MTAAPFASLADTAARLEAEEEELAVLRRHLPGHDEALARSVIGAARALRDLDLKKALSLSEVIDWARALSVLGFGVVDEEA